MKLPKRNSMELQYCHLVFMSYSVVDVLVVNITLPCVPFEGRTNTLFVSLEMKGGNYCMSSLHTQSASHCMQGHIWHELVVENGKYHAMELILCSPVSELL